MNDMDMLMDDSLDGGPPSVGSGDIPVVISTPGNNTITTPVTSKKVCKNVSDKHKDIPSVKVKCNNLFFIYFFFSYTKNYLNTYKSRFKFDG